jgi:hypothetical protein
VNALPLESTLSWAFKEWSGICAALLNGRQSVILRKGGIAEGAGPGDFRPEHPAFWLFPTVVHENQQGLRHDFVPGPEHAPGGSIPIQAMAVVEACHWVDDPTRLHAIEPYHVWTRETVERRFAYRHPGLWVLRLRIYRRQEIWQLAPVARYEGCRSWVPLEPAIPTEGLIPVLPDPEHHRRMKELRDALSARNAGHPGGATRNHA